MDDIYDPRFVKAVFDKCSKRYIAFSYWMSFGFTERWRRQCVQNLPEPNCENMPPAGPVLIDLMSGTGEAWPHLLKRFPAAQSLIAVDISSGMHRLAIERLHRMRAHRIRFIEDDVLASNLAPGSADAIISTFGLKTFQHAQHRQLAMLIAQTLKPGGSFSLIEASDPVGWWLRPAYRFHMAVILPIIERWLLRGAQDFAMIAVYSKNFGNARAMAQALRDAGLTAEYRSYFFGCASGVTGRRSE